MLSEEQSPIVVFIKFHLTTNSLSDSGLIEPQAKRRLGEGSKWLWVRDQLMMTARGQVACRGMFAQPSLLATTTQPTPAQASTSN